MVVGTSVATQTQPEPEDVAVVMGAGVIGLTALVQFKAYHVARIIVSDVSERRLQAAKVLGADVVLNPSEDNLVGASWENRMAHPCMRC